MSIEKTDVVTPTATDPGRGHGLDADRALRAAFEGLPMVLLLVMAVLPIAWVTAMFQAPWLLNRFQSDLLLAGLATFVAMILIVTARLRARGAATRQLVGGNCAVAMMLLFGVLMPSSSFGVLPYSTAFPSGWLVGALLLGAVTCMYMARVGPAPKRSVAERRANLAGSLVLVGFAVAVLTILVFTQGGRLVFRVGPEATRAWVESFDAPLQGSSWRRFSIAVQGLRAAGVEPDLSRAEAVVHGALERMRGDDGLLLDQVAHDAPEHVSPFALLAALDAGVASESILAVAYPEHPKRFENPTSLSSVEQDSLRIRALLHRGLEPVQRGKLARALLEEWPSWDDHNVLRTMRVIVGLLDGLGHEDTANQLRPDVHAALHATWCGKEAGDPAFASSEDNAGRWGVSSFIVDTPCFDAAWLMARLGVPEDLANLRLFDDWLRDEAQPMLFFAEDYNFALAGIAMLVEHEVALPGLPDGWWWLALLRERHAIGTLAFVLFCLGWTWSLPSVRATA